MRRGATIRAAFAAALSLLAASGAMRGDVMPSYGGRLRVDSPVRIALQARGALASWRAWCSVRGAPERADDGTWRFKLGALKEPSVAVTFRAREPGAESPSFVEWVFTPEEDVHLAYLGVMCELRLADYGGGTLLADGEAEPLPASGAAKEIRRSSVSRLELADRDGGRRLAFALREPVDILVQYWGGRTMELRLCVPPDDPATLLFRGGAERRVAFALEGAGAFVSEPATPVEIVEGAEWVPLNVPSGIAEGSALDFSEMRLTGKPCGVFGRVVARGPHFEFEGMPGVPQRFYGANLCFGACFPESSEQARDIARLLARTGYNAVRIHHHDGECVDRTDPARVRLDEGRMRRMDALVAACAEEGIYITTDLFVSRDRAGIPWRAIGVDRDGNMSMKDVKHSVPVHEGAYSNFLAFAANWLGRTNTVTGVRYADDPAIAWISLVNEGNIDFSSASARTSRPGWQEAWERWLAAKKTADPATWDGIPSFIPNGLGIDRHGRAFLVFLQDTEARFVRRTREFLRSLGCKALLTDMNDGWSCTAALLKTRAEEFDYMDSHYYIDHPNFLECAWMLPTWCPNGNPFRDESLGAASVSATRLLDKPFTVSEYNYCGPGRHRGVAGLATGAEAALQDWAGVWRFAWESDARAAAHLGTKPAGNWNNASDPLQLAADRAAICLFLRGDAEPLPDTYAVTLPPERISSPDARIDIDAVVDWVGAAWRTKIGAVLGRDISTKCPQEGGSAVGASLPGAILAGDFDEAYAKTSAQVWRNLEKCQKRQMSTIATNANQNLSDSATPRGNRPVMVDREHGVFLVSTPRTCGVFAEGGAHTAGVLRVEMAGRDNSATNHSTLDTRHLSLRGGASAATVWASSLDGEPLATSSRILVTHLTDLQNTGARFADTARSVLLDWGRLPYLVRDGKAKIELHLPFVNTPAAWRVWALAPDGTRVVEVPCRVESGCLAFTASVRQPFGACLSYEIAKE